MRREAFALGNDLASVSQNILRTSLFMEKWVGKSIKSSKSKCYTSSCLHFFFYSTAMRVSARLTLRLFTDLFLRRAMKNMMA